MPGGTHANLTRTDLHQDRSIKLPVRAASTANISTSSPGSTMDGVTLVSGDRILLKDQSTAAQNGIYVWTGSAAALTRATDLSASADFVIGFKVFVREGTANATTYWTYTTTTAVTVGTTSLAFVQDGTGTGSTGPTGPAGPVGPPGSTQILITGAPPYINLQDQKTSGTAGGTFTSGSYQTRTLNTVTADASGLVTLSANRVTLPAGTYRVHISCPASFVQLHKARLQNITDSATTLVGTSEDASAAGTYTRSVISGRFAMREAKQFEVQHRCSSTEATDGFGPACGFGDVEIYTIAEFWLIDGPPPFFPLIAPNPNASTQAKRTAHSLIAQTAQAGQQSKCLLPV